MGASAEKWAVALEVLRWARTVGIRPGAIACGAAIKACERGLQWEVAAEALEWMKKENLEVELSSSLNGDINVALASKSDSAALHDIRSCRGEDVQSSIRHEIASHS